MNVRAALKNHEKSISESCHRGKCKLNTAGLDNLVILDLDLFSKDTRTDYLIFHQDKGLDIGVCEMKSHKLDVSKIEAQLRASTDTALNIYDKCFSEHTPYRVVGLDPVHGNRFLQYFIHTCPLLYQV